ncbi:MAG: hypothetical protein M3Q48_15920, partial [Actinomycetota bacterium]|nr:hypothetical protein [Actinomycetota bacterium]
MATAAMYKLIGSAPDDGVTRALSGWSDERLQALLAARPDLADPPPPDFEALGFRAALAQSVAACRRHLDQWCLQVLDSLCLLSSPATVGALRRLLGHPVDEGDLDRALGRLEDLALVFRSGDELRPVHGAQELPYPAGLGPPADEVLGRRSAAELAAMARRLGATAGRTKTATLAALAGALADPTVVRAAVEGGPEGTDELVDELAWRYPAVSVPGGTAYLYDRTPVGWLANRGLVVPVSWNSVVMPREAGVGLRGGRPFPVLANRPPALDPVAVDAGAVDTAGAEHALRLVGDVATVLDAFGEAPPRMLKTGGVGIRDVRRMAKATGRTESGAAWLVELAGAAGLVAADEATGGALPTAAYDEWLGLEAPRRWSWLVAAWLGAELHLSVAGAIDAKDKPVPPLAPWCPEPHAVPQRRLVLEALAEAGTGGAVDTATLRQRIAWAGPAVWSA